MSTPEARSIAHAAEGLMLAEDWRALGFSTLAGLATAIGGILAVIKRPDQALLAFLLGTAIGVMATLSVLELMIRNAIDNGVWEVGLCATLGGAFYVCLEPLLPHGPLPAEMPRAQVELAGAADADAAAGVGSPHAAKAGARKAVDAAADAGAGSAAGGVAEGETAVSAKVTRRSEAVRRAAEAKEAAHDEVAAAQVEVARHDNLMRLGLLMAVTMTLHNLPEGFAVAFASFTDFGPLMALAVALHNIPEGLIVAAPIYAATGSRKQALAMAFMSGLSEPVGALVALLFIKPFLTPLRLQLMLAFVGGIMSAVCWVELLPEGRRCKNDAALLRGTLLGGGLMAVTLAYV